MHSHKNVQYLRKLQPDPPVSYGYIKHILQKSYVSHVAGVSTTSRTQHEMTRDPYPFLSVLEICLFKVMGIIHSSLLKITKTKEKCLSHNFKQLFTFNEFSHYDNL